MKKQKTKIKILIAVAILLLIILSSILIIAKKIDNRKRIELKKSDTTFEQQEANLEIKINNLYELVKLSNREIEIKEYTEGVLNLINGELQEEYESAKVAQVEIVKDSCYIEGDYIISELKIKYENNQEVILKLQFANSRYAKYPYLRRM